MTDNGDSGENRKQQMHSFDMDCYLTLVPVKSDLALLYLMLTLSLSRT